MNRRPPHAILRGGLRGVARVARGLGSARYAVSDTAALTVWAASPARRRHAVDNHRRAMPSISEREARRRARRSFCEYGRTTADFLWAVALDPEEVRRRSTVRGFEHIEAAARTGGGVLALSHFGSWDMAATVALAWGVRLTTVMAPLGPRPLTELVIWARQENRLEVFTPERAVRGLLRALREGRFVALLCDIPGGGPTAVVDYCGGPVPFSTVPAWLARRTGAPLLPVDCRRAGRERHYEVRVHRPVPAPHERGDPDVMQEVATVLEEAVRADPEQWYPFGTVYADAAPPAARRRRGALCRLER